jgi:hypothetical protein
MDLPSFALLDGLSEEVLLQLSKDRVLANMEFVAVLLVLLVIVGIRAELTPCFAVVRS